MGPKTGLNLKCKLLLSSLLLFMGNYLLSCVALGKQFIQAT